METHFILDTNAYRNLTYGKYLCELVPIANEMRIREKAKNAKSLMSVLVSMELLQHFDENDAAFENCFRALTLQYFHSQSKSYGEHGNSISFIPPLNPLITQHFFGNSSPYFKYYVRIVQIVEHATRNLEKDDYRKDKPDICLIAQQILHEKTEIRNNFEEFIKEVNGGIVDWNFFKKDSKTKLQLLKDIQRGRLLAVFGTSLMKRAHDVMELPFPQQDLNEKFKSFLKFYEPVLNVNQHLFLSLLNGATSLSNPKHKRWNSLNDMQLIAAACFASHRDRDDDVRVVIVSDDDGVHKSCQTTYLNDNVWTLGQYLSYIY